MSDELAHASTFLHEIHEILLKARQQTLAAINHVMVTTYWQIGQRIVEEEQYGADRADYGKHLLGELSAHLTKEFGRGFSIRNLENMRKFYLTYRTRKPIPQTASAELAFELTQAKESSSHSPPMFMLSWSHYVFLIAIKDDSERNFYEVEATQQQWALRELKRQFDSSLFERLALSRSKGEVRRLADEGQILSKPRDLLRDPYVLEFLALEERSKYSESDLETAIIDKLPHDANIFAAQYQLYLPSKEELKQKLMDWTAAQAED